MPGPSRELCESKDPFMPVKKETKEAKLTTSDPATFEPKGLRSVFERDLASLVAVTLEILILILDHVVPTWENFRASTPSLAYGILGLTVIATIAVVFRPVTRKAHKLLLAASPWTSFPILGVCLLLWLQIKPPQARGHGSDKVSFHDAALFNSWDDQPSQSRYIYAFGSPTLLMWLIDDEGAGRFSYVVDRSVTHGDRGISSGGYLTFYDAPCDRLSHKRFTFSCKASDFDGTPDIGIRLCVDEPTAIGRRRERVAYEISSLAKLLDGRQRLSRSWQHFEVDIGEFRQVRVDLPLPEEIDANTINKVVFFIDPVIAKKCNKATLWFRDIEFQ